MVKLNLLPPKEKIKKQEQKENFWAILLSSLTIIIIIGFSLSLMFFEKNLNLEIESINEDIKKQEEENEKYKEVEEVILALNDNIELIDSLEKKNIKWSEILKELKDRLPQDVRIEDLATTLESTSSRDRTASGPPILSIKGYSKSLYPAAKVRETLATSDLFEYVDFLSATEDENKNEYAFSLKIRVKTN